MPRSKTIYIKRRFRCSWLSEVPGEYSASLDKKCAWFAQAQLMIANFEPRCVLWQVWIGLAFCNYSFEVVFARQSKQPFAISVDMVAVKETFTALGNASPSHRWGKDSPEPRSIQPEHMGRVVALPQIGGHHRYERRAA